MAKRPIAVGLFACEQVIFENRTMNCTPVNCFSLRVIEQEPSEPLSFAVLACLTNGAGEVGLKLVIERLDNLDEVFQRVATVRFSDPLEEYRCVIRVRYCVFPTSGAYQIQLLADGDLIAQRRLTIVTRGDES
jgi:hypothetical protein